MMIVKNLVKYVSIVSEEKIFVNNYIKKCKKLTLKGNNSLIDNFDLFIGLTLLNIIQFISIYNTIQDNKQKLKLL